MLRRLARKIFKKQPKIIILSCVHGRINTVKEAFDNTHEIDKVLIYSMADDGEFCNSLPNAISYKHANQPLYAKWQFGVEQLRNIAFDFVVIMGSDNYFDDAFLSFIQTESRGFDLLAFSDIYFKSSTKLYYWPGYKNHRKGEPIGAGKVYSKAFLEKIDYQLFPESNIVSLDYASWNICLKAKAKIKISSIRENNLFLCDIKDGEGLTDLSRINDLELC